MLRVPRHLYLIVMLVVVVATYHAVITADFVNWDDTRFITKNPLFHGGVFEYAWRALSEVQFEAYQPVHLLAYVPDRLLWPTSATGFHIIELAIFIADLILVFRLARTRASEAAAACATLVIALHPLLVEPVAWITARKDLLALMFVLLALAREESNAPRRWVGILLYVLAVATKSAMVCFPPILFLWLVYMKDVPVRAALRRSLPYVVPAVASGIAVILIWRARGMLAPTQLINVLDIPGSWGFYVMHIVAPFDLAPLYPEHIHSWLGYATIGAVIFLIVVRARLPKPAKFVLLAFVCSLLPVSNVVPLLRYADRFTLLGLALLVPALAMLIDKRRWLCAVAIAIAAAEAYATVAQVATWNDSLALWAHAARAQPDAFYVRMKYGETLRDAGDFDASIHEYQAVVKLDPKNSLGYMSLFVVYATRAEHSGSIARGTTEAWMSQLAAAVTDPHQFANLWSQVASTGCVQCKDTLLVLGLLSWPQADSALLADADDALRRGAPDEALIFLARVTNHDDQYAALLARAATAGAPRPPASP